MTIWPTKEERRPFARVLWKKGGTKTLTSPRRGTTFCHSMHVRTCAEPRNTPDMCLARHTEMAYVPTPPITEPKAIGYTFGSSGRLDADLSKKFTSGPLPSENPKCQRVLRRFMFSMRKKPEHG